MTIDKTKIIVCNCLNMKLCSTQLIDNWLKNLRSQNLCLKWFIARFCISKIDCKLIENITVYNNWLIFVWKLFQNWKLFGNIWILFEIGWKHILIITLLGSQLNIFMMLWIGASLNSGIQISSCVSLIWLIHHIHINTMKKWLILALIV